MKYSDIKPKHIYYVMFDPVQGNEFRGNHLALVLKLNKDKRTAVVLPLTSSPQGAGGNKISLGYILSLPANLRKTETFAILDQVRTVDFTRFKQADEKGKFILPVIDGNLFLKIWINIFSESIFNIALDDKIHISELLYSQSLGAKLQDLAYNLKKEINSSAPDMEKILGIENKIIEIINNVPGGAWEDYVNADIAKIIFKILEK